MNPVMWRESNPIKNYIFFHNTFRLENEKIENEISKITYKLGLEKLDASLQGKHATDGDYWEYGSIDILNKERYKDIDKLIKKIFIVITVIFMTIFSIAAWLNYMLTSIIFRRREFAILRSVGMTYDQIKKMLGYEIRIQVFCGSAGGMVAGITIAVLQLLEYQESAAIQIQIPTGFVLAEISVASFLAVVTSLIAVKNVRDLNILENLKNEND